MIEPGAAITSLPHRRFRIVLSGRLGEIYIHVDASGLMPLLNGLDRPSEQRGALEDVSRWTMRRSRLRVLVALCRPMLTQSGAAARPATYAEIGEELGLSRGYVRNVVGAIREELTSYGVPGLVEDGEFLIDDFRAPLAHWALRHGWVSKADLTETGHVDRWI